MSKSTDPNEIKKASKLILPGVGHFNHGMKMLRDSRLIDPLQELVFEKKIPLLGICLGAQILGKGSEEGEEPGLGWIDMECKRFPKADNLPVPHMMWNKLNLKRDTPLLNKRSADARYYFVHSYYMNCANEANVVATTSYGVEFASVVQQDNIMGMQFHPEKSLKHGMAIMTEFNGKYFALELLRPKADIRPSQS